MKGEFERMENYCGGSIVANYFRGVEAVGGKIFFDEEGMIFKFHKMNIQKKEEAIKYNDIVGVKGRNTLGIIPNGILLITKEGKKHKFVVNKRSEIIKFLRSRIGSSEK